VSLFTFFLSARIAVALYLDSWSLTTPWNLSMLVIWTIAMVLYLYGYFRGETPVHEAKWLLVFSCLLIPWSMLIAIAVPSINSGPSAAGPLLDNLAIWTWEFKEISWIGSGLLLIVTSYVKIRTR
jgi:hypothetical protein